MSTFQDLPSGWIQAPLGNCGTWHGGGTPSKFNHAYWTNGTVPWVSPKDMKTFRITDTEDHLAQAAIEETNVKPFPAGTILVVVRSGILCRTLPVAVSQVVGTMNQDMKGLLPSAGIESEFIAYFLQAFEQDILRTCSKNGTTVASIDTTLLHSYPLRIAPLAEQRRIVARLEELFSDLDAGVAALKRAKANLKRYRAAVLKAAVEGKLTEEWRARHPAKEPATTLLARILRERRRKWEADQLARFAAAGKEPPKNWREKYVEPTAPVTTGLPELPDGWCWASIDQISECLDSMRAPVNKAERAKRTGDVPYYGANGLVGHIDDFIFDEPLVLVVEDETFVGRQKPFSYLITGKAWVNNHAHILRSTSATTTEFLNYALMFYPFIPMTTGTTARRKLTKQRLLEAPFALPPFDEQIEVVQAIEERLSTVDEADASIEASFVRATRLRQSILKQAFEGKLVPQDPTDEPASVMLERLQASRSMHAQNRKAATPNRPRGRRAKSQQLEGRADE